MKPRQSVWTLLALWLKGGAAVVARGGEEMGPFESYLGDRISRHGASRRAGER